MICKHILLITFLNEPMLILLHTVKWFQVLLCITNNAIKHQSFVYTQLNDQSSIFNNSIQYNLFVCTQLILCVRDSDLDHYIHPIAGIEHSLFKI